MSQIPSINSGKFVVGTMPTPANFGVKLSGPIIPTFSTFPAPPPYNTLYPFVADIPSSSTDELSSSLNSLSLNSSAPRFTETGTLFVDGGCNETTVSNLLETEAWASVVDEKGNCVITLLSNDPKFKYLLGDLNLRNVELPLIKIGGIVPARERTIAVAVFDDVKSQQNNGAELIALVIALRISEIDPTIKIINSDSELMIKWWSKGHVNPNTRKKMDKNKLNLIVESHKLRTAFEERGGQIVKIPGSKNLADLGFHK